MFLPLAQLFSQDLTVTRALLRVLLGELAGIVLMIGFLWWRDQRRRTAKAVAKNTCSTEDLRGGQIESSPTALRKIDQTALDQINSDG